jgi:hypothetical protein
MNSRELARRNNVPLEFKPIASPPAVIEAVKNGGETPSGHRPDRNTAAQQAPAGP